MKHAQKGFTLIEIMIVVAIIAILAAIAIPNFISYRKTSQMNACLANQEQIKTACEAYMIKNNAYPESLAKLSDSKNGFMKEVPTCPTTKSAYTYTTGTGSDGAPTFSVSCSSQEEGYKHTKGANDETGSDD